MELGVTDMNPLIHPAPRPLSARRGHWLYSRMATFRDAERGFKAAVELREIPLLPCRHKLVEP